MKSLINKILRECIDDFIIHDMINEDGESSKVPSNDEMKNTKSEIMDRMNYMIKNKNKNFLNILDNLGIAPNVDFKDLSSERTNSYVGFDISRKVTDDMLKIINILRGNIETPRGDVVSVVSPNGVIKNELLRKKYGDKTFNFIWKMKDMIDELGLAYTYDRSVSLPKDKDNFRYGITTSNGKEADLTNFDINNITPNHFRTWKNGSDNRKGMADNIALISIKNSIVEKYVRAKYGMGLNINGTTFANGNKKLPSDTLIVNFTSAYRCPAWNECLVKHACYARNGEYVHDNAKDANDTRNAMWEGAHEDPKLLELMMKLVRTYIVDYTKVAKDLLKKQRITDKNSVSEYANEMSNKKFSELDESEIEVINKYKKINDIRLNENGDFIGQWLVDAWDKNAADLKVIGVTTTAYTCRNLNYDNIKNIVINASRMLMKGNIARYFYCVSESVYNSFNDTYGGENNSLNMENGQITINPQPLYNKDTKETLDGNYYYKCPCGRTDLSKKGVDKVSCYQCRMCYQPKNVDGKCFVLVCAHGGGADEMPDIVPKFGVSYDFNEKYNAIIAAKEEEKNKKTKVTKPKKKATKSRKKKVTESVEYGNIDDRSMQDMAMNIITRNAITSVNEHLNNL